MATAAKTFSMMNEAGTGWVTFHPGDEVPEWAAQAVTNPKVLTSAPAPKTAESPAPPAEDPNEGTKRAIVGTKAELEQLAAAEGIDLAGCKTKADIVARIEQARG